MKKALAGFVAVVFAFGMVSLAEATMVSFVTPFSGVDGTSGWSTSDSNVNLGISSFTILGGAGTVTGYRGSSAFNLSHRGTRGLGVYAGELDEVDSQDTQSPERIEITFGIPHTISYLELRSLFYPESGLAEEADVYYYLSSSLIGKSELAGTQALGSGNGIVSISPNLTVDKILFQVDTGQCYTGVSEFAVAKLDLTPIPEPATLSLLGMSLLGLAGFRKRFRS